MLLPGVTRVQLENFLFREVIFEATNVNSCCSYSPRLAAHLRVSLLVVEPLMNTEEFAISCGKRHSF